MNSSVLFVCVAAIITIMVYYLLVSTYHRAGFLIIVVAVSGLWLSPAHGV